MKTTVGTPMAMMDSPVMMVPEMMTATAVVAMMMVISTRFP
jgi:hypothetical protein